MTWRAGVDVFTLGATKNGALSAEAIVSFDDRASDELHFRTKRAGHVTSKMRFQSTQLIAYLTDDLWLRTARHSNEQMRALAAGLRAHGIEFVNRPDVNMAFLRITDDEATALEARRPRLLPDLTGRRPLRHLVDDHTGRGRARRRARRSALPALTLVELSRARRGARSRSPRSAPGGCRTRHAPRPRRACRVPSPGSAVGSAWRPVGRARGRR